ncbi:MAG: type II secretion system major pseudopilin GspG [Candidatus Thiodiazotropha sp. (ex Lucina aurantia)]|uniref:Type II secretion system core protein G n=1 Tax=Candidatus Thiodiazotropha endolucinida TaxID=1655433 RepID=A0A7Z0VKW3_9GAMM|nr:type II secretion system major pseudopilin GspG [Candidatus Thiodiazotropha endolucinida]MBT3011043.1 type II secretion system major pseudopilin GspG [Candidatus Thiodiazotropha sp. (ex Lucina pensylvanica)]MBT3014592.1 type II secretion system major pseudopilin GspG [Candidatus Thiodiazotropha taylori]MBT3041720.1 type II secretion system major pseudopilin GspG [Candidatus Thiodiazotropha sp. (ex Codakia orbicularis)]MBV2101724.1 type II secretion system major pseudopilin GspG [Candidatus T
MKLIPCRNRYSGFTLIELLVVMAILAMLAGLVGPKVMNALGESKSKTARVQLEELSAALDIYRLDTGNYPRSHHGLRALVERVDGVENWNGPYLKKRKLPKDPWGAHYIYSFPGEHGDYDLYSLGADGAEGGDGEAKDIKGWE